MTKRRPAGAQRSDAERIHLFLDVSDRVLSRRALRNGLHASWEWEWDETNNDIRFFCNRSDEDDLRSLAIDLRKFTSEDEDVFLFRIFNALWLESSSTRIREQSAALREEWTIAQVDTEYPHGRDEEQPQLTPIDSWKLWINGGLFHDDKVLSEKYAALPPPDRARVDMLAVRLMMSLVSILISLRTIIWNYMHVPGY